MLRPKRAGLTIGAEKTLPAPEHDIEATPSAMARMSAANRSDTTCVPRYRKPVVNRRANAAALDRWLARPMVPGY